MGGVFELVYRGDALDTIAAFHEDREFDGLTRSRLPARLAKRRRIYGMFPVVLFDAVPFVGLDDLGLTAVAWTQLKLAVLAAVGATMVITRRDLPFVLVVAWAAFGIATKQADTPAVSGAATTVALLALALAFRDGLLRLSGR